jgi:SAM-dependent MidA family methyltransferase
VNFTQLQLEGERAGLKTAIYESQRAFLTRITERRGIRADEVRQFQTLTHPEHLGDKFRVLVQERNSC